MNIANNKILYVIIILFSESHSQNALQNQFDLANQLFFEEKYFDSITEFKRLQYFDKEEKYAFVSNYLMGKSYKAGGWFDKALKYFTLAERKASSDNQLVDAKILKARTNMLRGSNLQAERILLGLLEDKKYYSDSIQIYYWLGWNYILSDNWKRAEEIFEKNYADSVILKLCRSVLDEKFDINFAKYSSYFIPGMGQFYTGEYLSGILSLGWNILTGYLTINAFSEDRIFDGLVIGNLLWFRFYRGNIENSEKFALEKNLEISNKALKYLQMEFNGLKP